MNEAYKAYKEVCTNLGIKPETKTAVQAAYDAWGDKSEGTLVIVPNVVLKHDELYDLVKKFRSDAYIYSELLNRYTAEELSGTGEGKVRFLIVLDETIFGTVAKQKENLPKNRCVPSVFEAICFFYALRATGKKIDFNSTYIRHFDLEPKSMGDWSRVPRSFVDRDGRPRLGGSDVEGVGRARLAVGSNLNLKSSSVSSSLEQRVTILEEKLKSVSELLGGL